MSTPACDQKVEHDQRHYRQHYVKDCVQPENVHVQVKRVRPGWEGLNFGIMDQFREKMLRSEQF